MSLSKTVSKSSNTDCLAIFLRPNSTARNINALRNFRPDMDTVQPLFLICGKRCTKQERVILYAMIAATLTPQDVFSF